MSAIWKYAVAIDDEIEIVTPCSCTSDQRIGSVLHAAVAADEYHMLVWAVADPRADVTHRHRTRVSVRGTGQPLNVDPSTHVVTFTTPLGLVWHVFASAPTKE